MLRNLVVFLSCVQDVLILFLCYSAANKGAFSLQAVPDFDLTTFTMIRRIYILVWP